MQRSRPIVSFAVVVVTIASYKLRHLFSTSHWHQPSIWKSSIVLNQNIWHIFTNSIALLFQFTDFDSCRRLRSSEFVFLNMLHYFGFSEYHHIHKMTSRKSTVFMFFGIIIGLCFGILFKNYRALELVKKCSLRPNTGKWQTLNLMNFLPFLWEK